LRNFELGITKVPNEKRSLPQLTDIDRAKLRQKALDEIEAEGRDARLTEMAIESLRKKKLDKLDIIPDNKKNTTLFL
jgi:hypothetical protein